MERRDIALLPVTVDSNQGIWLTQHVAELLQEDFYKFEGKPHKGQ